MSCLLCDSKYSTQVPPPPAPLSFSLPCSLAFADHNLVVPGFSGANTPDHLHNMGSMALGLGTSAVGSPGFGQFSSQNPGAFGHPQLGGGLFAHTATAASGGSHGVYHPFGSPAGTSLGPQSSGLNTGVSPYFRSEQAVCLSIHS